MTPPGTHGGGVCEVSTFPGVHTGASTGVHVDVWAGGCWAGGAGGAGAGGGVGSGASGASDAAAGGLVLIAGAVDSNGDRFPDGVTGEGVGGSVSRAGTGGNVSRAGAGGNVSWAGAGGLIVVGG